MRSPCFISACLSVFLGIPRAEAQEPQRPADEPEAPAGELPASVPDPSAEQPSEAGGPPADALLSSRDLVRGESYGAPGRRSSSRRSEPSDRWNPKRLGQVAISVENLFGLYSNAVGSGGDYQRELHGSFSGGGIRNPTNIPRIGVDVFIGSYLTLGLSGMGYTGPAQRGWLANPRVGFYWGIQRLALWPRVGFSFFESGTKAQSDRFVQNGSNLSLELPLVVRIVPAVSATAGPSFHIPLSGKLHHTDTFTESKVRSLGGYVGLVVGF